MKGLLQRLLNRPAGGHKGTFGRIGVLAGSESMLGAAALTSVAALRMGSGLVYVYSHAEIQHVLKDSPELLVFPVISGNISADLERVLGFVRNHRLDVLAIGPGLGQTEYVRDLVQGILAGVHDIGLKVVLDADALNVLTVKALQACSAGALVLTPHVGEFKRLFPDLAEKLEGSDEARCEVALEAARLTSHVVVLKGQRTVVAFADQVYVNETGNAAMATAGMGDVLTGMIASLLGQGFSEFEAAKLGVYLHGFLGDVLEKKRSIGLLASDISEAIPSVLVQLRDTLKRHESD